MLAGQPGTLIYGNSGGTLFPLKVAADGTLATNATLSGTFAAASAFHLVSAASTNLTVIKNAPGVVTGYFIYNANTAARKLVFHDSAIAPTAGAGVLFALVIPPLSGANASFPNSLAFLTGIAISTVTGLADTDATPVSLNDLTINIWFI